MKRLICDGIVYDGTGCGPRKMDVMIRDGVIAAVGKDLPREDAEIIEAEGMVITPGFIDIFCSQEEYQDPGVTRQFL